jgi:hypothetical protein
LGQLSAWSTQSTGLCSCGDRCVVVQSADALKTAQLYARSKLAADVRTGRVPLLMLLTSNGWQP